MVSEKKLVRYQTFWYVFLYCTFVIQPLWNRQVWIIQVRTMHCHLYSRHIPLTVY